MKKEQVKTDVILKEFWRPNDRFTDFFNAVVRTVFEISRGLLNADFDSIRANYKDRELAPELVSVIGKITESSYLMKQGAQLKGTNMCTALEKLKQESIEYGMECGIRQGIEQNLRALIRKWTGKGFRIYSENKMTSEKLDRLLKWLFRIK